MATTTAHGYQCVVAAVRPGTLAVMPDCSSLRAATDRLAGRFRALPQSRLRGGAGAAGLDLARWLSARAQELEFPGREPLTMPDDGLFVVGDQIAVSGHDLAAALTDHRDAPGTQAGSDLLAESLRRVAETAALV